MFYPKWLMLFYNFAGLFCINKNTKNEFRLCEKFQIFLLFKVLVMILINGAYIINPNLSLSIYNKKVLASFMSPFATNVVIWSSHLLHIGAISLILTQFVKGQKIVKFFTLISNLPFYSKIIEEQKKYFFINFSISLIFFLTHLIRVFVQIVFHSLKAYIIGLVALQSHLIHLTLINIFDEIKKIIIFGYKEVQNN